MSARPVISGRSYHVTGCGLDLFILASDGFAAISHALALLEQTP